MNADDLLVTKVKAGDKHAMNQLVKEHYNVVFAFVYRKIGNYHMSYDITQEIFIKMIKSIKKYRHKGKFIHWLLKIAVNHCNDYYRSHKNKEDVPLDAFFDLESSSDPQKETMAKLDGEVIKKLVLTLPDYQRDVIILRLYNGLKFKEIAQITKSNEATVKSRYRQGLSRLKGLIKEDIHFEE